MKVCNRKEELILCGMEEGREHEERLQKSSLKLRMNRSQAKRGQKALQVNRTVYGKEEMERSVKKVRAVEREGRC